MCLLSSFTYTQIGQLATETGPWTSNTLTYTYNQGHRASLSLNSQIPTINQTYGYDSAWRLQSLASLAGAFNYGYTPGSASGLVRTIGLPNAASIIENYDSLARLNYTALLNYWGHPLDGYAYISDSWGLRTNITRQLGLSTNIVTSFFDGIGQLMTWSGRETNGTLRQNEQSGYTFDAAGNLNYRTNGAMIQTFTVNTLNQISNVTRTGTFTVTGATPAPVVSVTVNGAVAQTNGDFTFASAGNTLANGNNTFTIIAQYVSGARATNSLTVNLPTPVNFQHDANGNLTNDGTRWFFYDAENQLTNVTSASQWQVVFVYDGFNRRRIERDYTCTNNTWLKTNETRFLYDGMQVIQERDTNNNPVATYTRGLDLSMSLTAAGGIGGMLARTDANGSTFFHSDANGNVTALMDGNQNMVARYEYDGSGRLINKQGTMEPINRIGFSSFYSAFGIVLSPTRPYFPELQRWGSSDPAQEAGGINLYEPMGNNLLNNIDPYGLVNYESWPFIGPVVSNARLNAFARQHSDAQGNSFQDYNDMKRYLDEKRHYNNPQGYQSGDIATVQGIEDLTKAAATTYVIAATSVTPTAAGTKCVNLLLPGGKALGQAGTKATIRELQGGLKEAQALFDELSQGGKVVSGSTYKGTLVELPEGGTIGIRTDMTRSPGTAATIDINIPNIPINKVKFNP